MEHHDHPHQTHVKFTGSGYRAHCWTRGCRFVGQHHTLMRDMAMGRTMAAAAHKAQTLATDDARRHVSDEKRKTLRRSGR